MKIKLLPNETRVLGVLFEKEVTTPEQYPLSLNTVVNACNQKSNRDPVLSWDEGEVQEIIDELIEKRLVKAEAGYGSRVVKYKHWFCNTEFGDFNLTKQELGIICVLFLRGPQTPGELRTRTNRLCDFTSVGDVEVALNGLMTRDDGPFAMKLEREPGKREARYAHLFCGEVEIEKVESTASSSMNNVQSSVARTGTTDRVAKLEEQVVELQDEIKVMKAQLSELFD